MNILIVSFSYAPMLSPQAFRWAAISRELARRGHAVTVVAGWEPGCERQESDGAVIVHRVGGRFIERVRMLRTRSQRQDYTSPHSTEVSKEALRVSLSCLKRIHDVTWKKLYWPDAHCTWLFPALHRARKLVKASQIDAVVTVDFPFTCHIVGVALKNEFPQLRWLCDMSDPFSYLEPSPPNNRALYGWLNRRLERHVFERTDWMVVRYGQMENRYSELYPHCRAKIVVVPDLHTTSSNEAPPVMSSHAQPGKPRRRMLAFVGTLDGRSRDPRSFLEGCRRIIERGAGSGFEVHFYGKIGNCDAVFDEYQAFYNHWLFVHGPVVQRVALKVIQEADVLVNIGNRYQCQTPSKLIDYASTGNPILNIVGCSSDLSIGALSGYKAALHLVSNNGALSEAQISKMEDFLHTQQGMPSGEVRAWMEKFALSPIVSSYESYLTKGR